MVTKRTPPFTVTLTDEERKRLEAHRVALGARSLSDVIRIWIARGPDAGMDRLKEQQAVGLSAAKALEGLTMMQRRAFNPQPKKR